MNSLLLTDGYKTSHHKQYPEGTTLVFSNFTPRSDKYSPTVCRGKGIVVFGTQLMLKQIHDHFKLNFFDRNKEEVISEIKRELELYLGVEYDVTHFEQLHTLGYLPIEVRALNEGTVCPIRVPMMTIHNTIPEFFWITNYLESIVSNLLWKPVTSATIAKSYREVLLKWAEKTDKDNLGFIDFQGHDFSMRGLDSIDATISSGLGHLTSFLGTDSLPTLWGARKYYGETGFVAASVPATEHSVMCAGSKEDETQTFKRLMETYPTGILSVVSDTWDLWNVITRILPSLKEQILGRDGKLVIRPDSGDPVDIICGINSRPRFVSYDGKFIKQFSDSKYLHETHLASESQVKGVIELLWDIFGGTVNEQGYKVLDSHIGAIYGDSITTDRAKEICKRLEAKGFASTNIVLGVGSFTYQYNTRDTFGFAMKATYVEKEGVGFAIFKDPITDDGVKKSAKGLLKVIKENNNIVLKDGITWEELKENDNLLKVRYVNGEFFNETTLTEIRSKLK